MWSGINSPGSSTTGSSKMGRSLTIPAPILGPQSARAVSRRQFAAVAVDFEREGLLKGTRGRAREARRQLLTELADDGVGVGELRRAVEEERLALLPVERFLEGTGRRYTIHEVADEAGVEPEFLIRNRQALGLPLPSPEAQAATTDDVETAKR